ncbi:MAG: DUF86 domain-containing protein [Candidatus Aminicenantaceae bacterium]
MKIDKNRLNKYLLDTKSRTNEIKRLLDEFSNEEVLSDDWKIKGLKYLIVEMAEIMANTLTHILTRDKGESITGYIETIIKSGEIGIISQSLTDKLKPFFDFRNSLVHRYWMISDEKFLDLVRKNYKDFLTFIEEIEKYIKNCDHN